MNERDLQDPRLRDVMHVVSAPGEVPPIRIASSKDFSTFRSLWKGLVIDQDRRGGPIAWEERTMACLYEPLFWAYVRGEIPGVCLLAGLDRGVLLWGAPLQPSPVTLRDGPVGFAWGTYVEPSARGTGISKRLREYGKRLCRELGFKRLEAFAIVPEALAEKMVEMLLPGSGASIESGIGAGFRLEGVTGSLYLDEEQT